MNVEQEILRASAEDGRSAEERAAALRSLAGAARDAPSINALALAVRRVIGEHLNHWAETRTLVERALAGARDVPPAELLPALMTRAMVLTILGDEGVHAAVAQLPAGSTEERTAFADEVGLVATDALIRAGDLQRACRFYREAMAGNIQDRLPARTLAVVSHNLSSALLSSKGRNATENRLMEDSARQALYSWQEAGSWINWARAEYMLASVLAALGRHSEASAHAMNGIKSIKENGEEPVDEAFLRLKLAQCRAALNDVEASREEHGRARALRDNFPSEDLKEWFDRELGSA